MQIRGRVPVDGPVQVKAYVLDPATLHQFLCDESTSGFEPTEPGNSNFSLSVRDECIEGRSGNIRICWADDRCAPLIYQPGEVDVGLLQAGSDAPTPPDGGSGAMGAGGGLATGDPSAADTQIQAPNTGTGYAPAASVVSVVDLAGVLAAAALAGSGVCAIVAARRKPRARRIKAVLHGRNTVWRV
jgi:hypothetical protein